MNIVVDEEIMDICLDILNPKFRISYVNCSEAECADENISRVYAKCVDKNADLYIGQGKMIDALRSLGISCLEIGGVLDA